MNSNTKVNQIQTEEAAKNAFQELQPSFANRQDECLLPKFEQEIAPFKLNCQKYHLYENTHFGH